MIDPMMQAYLVIHSEGVEHRMALGYSQVCSVLWEYPAGDPTLPIVGLLCRHPSSAVRRAMADRFALPADAVRALEADTCPEVLYALVLGNAENRAWLSTASVLRVLDAHVDAASTIVGAIDDFAAADREALESALLNHPDPEVRREVARCWGERRAVKRALMKDADPIVRWWAAQG
jgi:hypothetical protein